MKSILQLVGAGVLALTFVGCATSDRQARQSHRHYVIEDHPIGREVIVDRRGHRTYVRDDRMRPEYRLSEPRVRGKHAKSLGWNRIRD